MSYRAVLLPMANDRTRTAFPLIFPKHQYSLWEANLTGPEGAFHPPWKQIIKDLGFL